MDVGIGLPNAVPGTTSEQLLEWARRADARGFSTLGTIDRLVFDNYDPLTALTGAAAVTERIGLTTSVMLGPLRGNPVALAKQTQSIQALSGGRLTLGMGVGAREDDFEMAGVPLGERGKRMDSMLESMQDSWADPKMGPAADRPRVLLGGFVDAAYERAAKYGDGYIGGSVSPEVLAQQFAQMDAAWAAAGREGKPQNACLASFSLGDRAEEDAVAYVSDYYAFLGEEYVNQLISNTLKDADSLQATITTFADAGCEELILIPSASDPDQVDMLADAINL